MAFLILPNELVDPTVGIDPVSVASGGSLPPDQIFSSTAAPPVVASWLQDASTKLNGLDVVRLFMGFVGPLGRDGIFGFLDVVHCSPGSISWVVVPNDIAIPGGVELVGTAMDKFGGYGMQKNIIR